MDYVLTTTHTDGLRSPYNTQRRITFSLQHTKMDYVLTTTHTDGLRSHYNTHRRITFSLQHTDGLRSPYNTQRRITFSLQHTQTDYVLPTTHKDVKSPLYNMQSLRLVNKLTTIQHTGMDHSLLSVLLQLAL